MKNFKGIIPALITPFDQNNKINAKQIEKIIQMNLKKGVTGFYIGGSTAEVFLLSEKERNYIYEAAMDAADGKCTLIAHVGCISTSEAISFAQHAEKLGYDAVSSISPFYYKFSFEEIKKYYFDLLQNVALPMIIYNFPAFSGVTLSVDNIGEFLKKDRVIGLKHTSNDFFALERFKTLFPNKIIYNGFDEMLLAGLSMGADGGIGSTYNFMAEKYIQIYDLFQEGKIEEAKKIQTTANIIIEALIKVGVIAGVKEMLTQTGFDCGDSRAPFKRLTDDDKEYLKKTVLPLL